MASAPFIRHKGNGFVTALRSEAFVISRSFSPWILVALPALAVFLRLSLVKLSGAPLSEEAESATGYGHMVDGFRSGFTLLYLVLIAYAAYSFASDRDIGVLRHLIIRRVSRRALVTAKLLVLHALAAIAVIAVLLSTWLLSRLFWDLGPVVEDGFEIIGEAEIRREIRLGLGLALIPLPACLALGLLISVLARSATQAVALAVGASLLLDVFKGVLGDAAYYVYASFQPSLIDESYLSEVTRIVRGYSDVLIKPELQQLNIWVPLPQAIAFLALALIVVSRRRL